MCNDSMLSCPVQLHARLQQDLASSKARSSELEAREQELQHKLSSREAELLSAESRLSEQQAAQTDTQMQLQMVWHDLLCNSPVGAVLWPLVYKHFLYVSLQGNMQLVVMISVLSIPL